MILTDQEWYDLLQEKILEFEPGHFWVNNRSWDADLKGKDTLVVTVGDSWTWGDGGLSDRLNQTYGRLVSNYYDADWLNIGGCGYSNTWIFDFANIVIQNLKDLSYQKIIFLITMTEQGRDIATAKHCNPDYTQYDNDESITEETFDKILSDIEDIYIEKLTTLLSNMDDRYSLVIGSGFTWHQKTTNWLNQQKISQPHNITWVELLADKQKLIRPPRTNLIYNFTFSTNLPMLIKYCPKLNGPEWKRWMIQKAELADQVHQFLQKSNLNFEIHPTADGHRYWAEEMIRILDEAKN